MKWRKGESGNLNGRPRGKSKQAELRKLIFSRAPELIQKAGDMALEGDITALRLLLDKILPTVRADAIVLGKLNGDASLTDKSQKLVDNVLSGEIDAYTANLLMGVLAQHRQNIELEEMQRRLEMLEQNAHNNQPRLNHVNHAEKSDHQA